MMQVTMPPTSGLTGDSAKGTTAPPRRAALVVNTRSGGARRSGVTAQSMLAMLEKAGVSVVPGDCAASIERQIEAALAADAQMVVVAGGDGTIGAVGEALQGTGKVLGIVPLGTMNLLAKDLAIPITPEQAVQVLATGTPVAIDIGEVNGRFFMINSVLGFATRIARQRERLRGDMKPTTWFRLLWSIGRTQWRDPRVAAVGRTPTGYVQVRTRSLAVVVNDYQEAFGEVFKREAVGDGRFTLYAFRRTNIFRLIKLGIQMLLGRWKSAVDFDQYEVARLVVSSRKAKLRVMNDGELILMEPPLRYVIHRRALTVMLPASSPGASA